MSLIEISHFILEHLEIIGTIVGVIYLILEYRASIHLWIAGIIMPAIYIFVYYRAGLYADFGINIYYLIVAVYGWIAWKWGNRHKSENRPELLITHLPYGRYLPLLGVFAAAWVGIAYILANFTDSNVVLLDSFTTALSIVGMWLLARKYVEQWLSWIAVDAVSAGLYVYKELYFTAGLYAVYTIIAIFGYFKWKRMMSQQ